MEKKANGQPCQRPKTITPFTKDQNIKALFHSYQKEKRGKKKNDFRNVGSEHDSMP